MSLGISYKFSATDGISIKAKKIARNVDKITNRLFNLKSVSERSSRVISKSFNRIKKSSSGAASSLRGYIVAATGAFALKNVISRGMKFQDSMASVAAITGASTDQLKIFEDESIRLSKKFGSAASDIADSFLLIGSAKSELLKSPDKLSEIVEQTLLLSKAGGVSMPVATDVMTKSLNMWKVGADKAGEFADKIIQGTVVGAAQMDDVGKTLLNVGTNAASIGMSFEDANTIIQVLSKGALVGERAGTAFDAFIREMSSKKGLKEFSIKSVEDIDKFITKLNDVLKQPGVSISDVFGDEAKRAVQVLISHQELLKSFKKGIVESEGATKKAAKIKMATLSARLSKARARMDLAMLKLFEKLEPTIKKMTDDFSSWIDNLKSGDIENFNKSLEIMITGFKKLASFIGEIFSYAKGIAEIGGQTVAAIQTGDYKQLKENMDTKMNSFWNNVDEFFGINQNSDTNFGLIRESVDVNINVSDPGKTIENVQSKSTGRKAKVKTNMSN